ncbi:2-dehydropantoate 2-reductase [Sphaerulina musiva SO2202]|uniref:2-dehydropantoate 2-reductase n=1 Tax=Sphaerulina musiva (strain SO2202) TaxID=692275 RepID=M3C1Q7_SPHMS|nr:2-dehydropantoate 2-reductase [Sphaerulina musiva SO2202]EMF14246.1 2-dehydropantoate 2-reductase [Sphaerulina musiva SO2202]
MPRILLHGTGAIGTIYAYQLMQAGCDVTVTCRSNYEAVIKQNGFHLDSVIYGEGLHLQPKVVRSPLEAVENSSSSNEEGEGEGVYDYLLVACKAIPEAQISETIAPAVTRGRTTIVLLQNGIGIEEEYSKKFPENLLLSGVVYCPVTQTSPGYITMGDVERLEIGEFSSSSSSSSASSVENNNKNSTTTTTTTTTTEIHPSTSKFLSLLKSGGGNPIHYHPSTSMQERRWFKLLLNAPWNPICALTLSRDLAFLAAEPCTSLAVIRGVLDEVIAISRALGYHSVTAEAAEQGLATIMSREGIAGIEPSMLVDVLWTRRMEHEVILGNPVRVARKLGVEVPRMEMLYALVKALDLSHQKRKEGRSLDMYDLA